MPKPIQIATDFSTHRGEMRKTINAALPRRKPVFGLMLGFACTIALVWGASSLALTYFSGG